MSFFKSLSRKKSLTLKRRKDMNPQKVLAAIDDSVHFDTNSLRGSLRSSTTSTKSMDSFTSVSQDEISKMNPQEILLLLEYLGSNNCDLSESEKSLQMAKALQQLESSNDEEDDIFLDDIIPKEANISR